MIFKRYEKDADLKTGNLVLVHSAMTNSTDVYVFLGFLFSTNNLQILLEEDATYALNCTSRNLRCVYENNIYQKGKYAVYKLGEINGSVNYVLKCNNTEDLKKEGIKQLESFVQGKITVIPFLFNSAYSEYIVPEDYSLLSNKMKLLGIFKDSFVTSEELKEKMRKVYCNMCLQPLKNKYLLDKKNTGKYTGYQLGSLAYEKKDKDFTLYICVGKRNGDYYFFPQKHVNYQIFNYDMVSYYGTNWLWRCFKLKVPIVKLRQNMISLDVILQQPDYSNLTEKEKGILSKYKI